MSTLRLSRAAAAAGLALLSTGPVVLGAQSAQAAAGATPAVNTAPAAQTTPAVNTVAPNYAYDPQGRRDPFVSLIGRGVAEAAKPSGPPGDGLLGLGTAELSVRGILFSRGGYVAIVQGPDQKTHLVRPADRLSDGTVKAITPQGLVIVQEVNDPLSLVKQKEIRKTLAGSDEGK